MYERIFENIKKQTTLVILAGIFFLGFGARYLSHGPKIFDLDSWFFYRLVDSYILKIGYIPDIDPLSYYPVGRDIWNTDQLYMPYFIAYTYKLIQPLGISLMQYFVAFPAIYGAVAAVALYFVVKELLDNERAGLYAALLYATIPGALSRVNAGITDKESMSFLMFLWLYFFIKSCKELDLQNKKSLIHPVMAGVFFGPSLTAWGGSDYYTIVIAISTLLYMFFKREERVIYALLIMYSVGFLIAHFFQPGIFSISRLWSGTALVILTSTSFICTAILLSRYIERKWKVPWYHGAVGILALSVALIFILGKQEELFYSITGYPRRFIFGETGLQSKTVAEQLQSSFFGPGDTVLKRIMNGHWFEYVHYLLFILPAAIAVLVSKRLKPYRDYASVFCLVWVFSGMLAMNADIRLNFVFAPSVIALCSYALFYGYESLGKREEKLMNITAQPSKKKRAKQAAESEVLNLKIAKYVLIAIIFATAFINLNAGTAMLNGRTTDLPTPWYDALVWVNGNTPEDSVILSWWDYGYWIQAVANRYTVVDGGNTYHDRDRDGEMAHMFTSGDENESIKYIKYYVDPQKTPTYLIVSFEEFGKSGAINYIAQDDLVMGMARYPVLKTGDEAADYEALNNVINELVKKYTIYPTSLSSGEEAGRDVYYINFFMLNDDGKPEMKNKLLARLLPFLNTGSGAGLDHFKLVYRDSYRVGGATEIFPGYILIYQVV